MSSPPTTLAAGRAALSGRTYDLSIDPDGTIIPCVATGGRITGSNVVADGVEAAWRRLHGHGCVACYSPCLVEQNYSCPSIRG